MSGVSNEDNHMAYLAGLIDGEGCITYKQRTEHRKGMPRAYKYWNIRIEINVTDESTINFVNRTFKCGALDYSKPYPHQNHGQYRWRRSHRDAFKVAMALYSYSITKKDKLKQIINHYVH